MGAAKERMRRKGGNSTVLNILSQFVSNEYTVKFPPFGIIPHRSAASPHFRIVSNFYAASENGDGVKIGDDAKMQSGGES